MSAARFDLVLRGVDVVLGRNRRLGGTPDSAPAMTLMGWALELIWKGRSRFP